MQLVPAKSDMTLQLSRCAVENVDFEQINRRAKAENRILSTGV